MYINKLIAKEISTLTRYYDLLVQWRPRSHDTDVLFDLIDCRNKSLLQATASQPDFSENTEHRSAILLNGNFNHEQDIQSLLSEIKSRLSRNSRLVVVMYNPYLSWLYKLANRFGFRPGETPSTFITRVDLANLAKIAGYTIVRTRPVGYCPWKLFGLGSLINGFFKIVPLVRFLSFSYIVVLQPSVTMQVKKPSLSCVILAKNEKGNIESALLRLQEFPAQLEIIFVEGHSTDSTWEEIQRVKQQYREMFSIKAYQQTGVGKSEAVRLGFSKATGTLLTILEADLTMPPEQLHQLYEAYCDGHGDFINGSRLVYPMEGKAMRFLNRMGNIFFARALSWVLDIQIGDSLCGTKLMARHDYQRMIAWRNDFGDFDPFGDFEIIFPAAILGLGVVDVPVRYRARTYESTNISRFRHGWVLLKMTLIGFFKIKVC